jgi:hypothetical protein
MVSLNFRSLPNPPQADASVGMVAQGVDSVALVGTKLW